MMAVRRIRAPPSGQPCETPSVNTNFDERAATWDDNPATVERAHVVAGAIRDTVPLDPSVRMLEYGAGTGLVTQALRDSVGPVTLVDTSVGMREVMAEKIAAGAITQARVWDVDLSTGPVPDEHFDVIVTVMTMHHVPDVAPLLSNFAELLVEGGRLCIVDLEEEDGSFHGDGFHGHHGFDRAVLTSDLSEAGFTDIRFQRCHEMVRDGRSYPLFLATSVRHLDAAGS
jgi:ubiquinone/menaquinone biosynthesis C-methylase UbiE